ncbi:MAG: hypothetical protein ACTSUE_25575 [Promethearchaeota archaeon]
METPSNSSLPPASCEHCEKIEELENRLSMMEEANSFIIQKLEETIHNITNLVEKISKHKDQRVINRCIRLIGLEVGIDFSNEDEIDEIRTKLQRKKIEEQLREIL